MINIDRIRDKPVQRIVSRLVDYFLETDLELSFDNIEYRFYISQPKGWNTSYSFNCIPWDFISGDTLEEKENNLYDEALRKIKYELRLDSHKKVSKKALKTKSITPPCSCLTKKHTWGCSNGPDGYVNLITDPYFNESYLEDGKDFEMFKFCPECGIKLSEVELND